MHMALAAYFWRGDVTELAMELLAVVLLTVLLIALVILVMFGVSKFLREKVPEATYGDFDFDAFEKMAFQRFVMRLILVFGATTIGLHLLTYLVVCKEFIRHDRLWTLLLLLLETAAIVLGLHLMFKLDRLRLAIIAGGSVLAYVILISILRSSGYLKI